MLFTGREGMWLSLSYLCILSCAGRHISKDGKITQGKGQADSCGL